MEKINQQIVSCERCLRLKDYRKKVAAEKVRRFAGEEYWGRPVPGFGDDGARLFIVGLAPAAHGANRTGRMFTGDRSGDWLFRALHRAGFASQADSIHRSDGLTLQDCYIGAVARCAPPANKLQKSEIENCNDYLLGEFNALENLRVILSLGQLAFRKMLVLLEANGFGPFRPRPAFGHGAEVQISNHLRLISSYHPSQQNTFTGKLTEEMFDQVFSRVWSCLENSQ
ncbi:MAG: uracil-DNA glycosylase [Calditrichia bacterium]